MSAPAYKDYYKILGVKRGSDEKEIKSAYRRLARKFHPDVNPGDKSAEERFKEISEAYDVLGDATKRSQYDSYGDQWKQFSQSGPRTGWSPSGTGPGTEGFEFSFGGAPQGLSDLFETIFGGRQSRARRPAPRGEDVEFGIDVPLEDAMSGTVKEHTVHIEDICTSCRGSGATGVSRGPYETTAAPCPACKGRGRVSRARRLKVKVPAGVEDGRRLCLKGQGGAGPDGKRGDLYLVVRMRAHPDYELRNRDLHTSIDVPYTTAALGGEVTINTLTGSRSLTVPPGVQGGQRIRVSGQGLPNPGGKAGDLYAHVRIAVPKDLSARERDLLIELAGVRNESVRS